MHGVSRHEIGGEGQFDHWKQRQMRTSSLHHGTDLQKQNERSVSSPVLANGKQAKEDQEQDHATL